MNTFVAVITRSTLYWSRRRHCIDANSGMILLPFKQQRRVRWSTKRGWYFWWYGNVVRVSVRVQAKGRWVQ